MVEKPFSILIIKKLAACLRIPKSGLHKIVFETEIPAKSSINRDICFVSDPRRSTSFFRISLPTGDPHAPGTRVY